MSVSDILGIALPVVFIIVGVALVWFVVELALTIRRARRTIVELQDQVTPTLDNVDKIVADVTPVAAKIDPLVDRASLTVDAANLEMMRIDEILEDVTQMTDGATKAMDAVGAVTSAPLDLVTSVTEKVRSRIKPRAASKESVKLGEAEARAALEGSPKHAVRDLVDATGDAIDAAITGQLASEGTDAEAPAAEPEAPAAESEAPAESDKAE